MTKVGEGQRLVGSRASTVVRVTVVQGRERLMELEVTMYAVGYA